MRQSEVVLALADTEMKRRTASRSVESSPPNLRPTSFRWRTCVAFALALPFCSLSWAQVWYSTSRATGWNVTANIPETIHDNRQFNSVGAYASAGYRLETEALADAHPQAASTSRAHAFSRLDQSDPTNATLRQFSESRAVYFGTVTHPVSSYTRVGIEYGLQIENLAGVPLNIVFGNHIQGVMAQAYEGRVQVQEITSIEGFAPFTGFAEVDDLGNGRGTGGWLNAIFSQTYQDPYLGTIPAFRLNSFQFYGSRSFAAGETDTLQVAHSFEMGTELLQQGFSNGVAVSDFSGTAELTIRAYDSSNNDRTSEIRVNYVVPEPATMTAFVAGIGFLVRRRFRPR